MIFPLLNGMILRDGYHTFSVGTHPRQQQELTQHSLNIAVQESRVLPSVFLAVPLQVFVGDL